MSKSKKAWNEMKIYTFAPQGRVYSINSMFKDIGFKVAEQKSDGFDAICLAGGEDICPFLYGERPLNNVDYNPGRDLEEIKFIKSLDTDLLKIGICRGGQLLNVLAGGSMYQHVDKHHGDHEIVINPFRKNDPTRKARVNSFHHQLMRPTKSATIIAQAYESSIRRTQTEDIDINRTQEDEKYVPDVEICHYWELNALCFQPHPEYHNAKSTRELFAELVKYYID